MKKQSPRPANLRASRRELPPHGDLKHSHFLHDHQNRLLPGDFELRLAEQCRHFLAQFTTGFEVLNRFARVFGRFGVLFGEIARELEQMVYEESIALAQRYVFPEGEGVSNAALTWMDFMDHVKEVASLYKRASADSEELSGRIKASPAQKKSLEQIQGSLQAIINYIKRLNAEYNKPRDAANTDLVQLEKMRRASNANSKKQSVAMHKALNKAISDAENFKTMTNVCTNSFQKYSWWFD